MLQLQAKAFIACSGTLVWLAGIAYNSWFVFFVGISAACAPSAATGMFAGVVAWYLGLHFNNLILFFYGAAMTIHAAYLANATVTKKGIAA